MGQGTLPVSAPVLISERYRELNREAHEDPHYGHAARYHGSLVQAVIRATRAGSLLDYGAGKQLLRDYITVSDYRAYDPAVLAISIPPEPADVVYCGDVMEHVEPEYSDAVLADVVRLARKAAIFVICLEVGSRILSDGIPAHRNVRGRKYWRRRIEAFGRTVEYQPVATKKELRIVVYPDRRRG